MKKLFLSISLLTTIFAPSIIAEQPSEDAMDKLTNKERKAVLKRIREIEHARSEAGKAQLLGDSYTIGRMRDHITFQLSVIEEILDQYHIEHPKQNQWTPNKLSQLSKDVNTTNKKDLKRFSETGECPGCFLVGADLREIIKSLNDRDLPINLKGAFLNKTNLSGTNLTNARFEKAELKKSNLSDTNLTNANLHNAHLGEANLSNANLRDTNLESAYRHGAIVTHATFSKNSLKTYNEGKSHYWGYAKNLDEEATVYADDKDLEKFNETGQCESCCLTNLDLRDSITSLKKRGLPIVLGNAWLDGSNLSGTDLSHADLSYAKLKGANLSKSNLTKTDLFGAYLLDATLQYAHLHETNMLRTDLTNADLRNIDLKQAKKINLNKPGIIIDDPKQETLIKQLHDNF